MYSYIGIANTIAMAPGGVIIEITRDYAIPRIGPFSPFDNWALALGFHHFLFNSKSDAFEFDSFFENSMRFLSNLCLKDVRIQPETVFNMSIHSHRPAWCERFEK